ncbi:acylneuraminate cytidylyltransferase family protein [Novosphingobium beihaiensis]|uniref:Acylneuraminate cytidylyltransferase family protein n=1 Tax=Novosphingobium beihaiensis TaxID=2930389 RepID=A0ABT0BUQ4_9SPHN|nr:acylneuraminate cytidylyltransferase family protein [Novosphingobium beihaiensis]MCJ2188715.1 acylneuraminate cytidylyltransferase family protein [Novosphingobium beihaiensis]
MNASPIFAMIPCRKGSQRIPNKNTRPLPGYPGGLLELKLRQVFASHMLDGVVLSTDDLLCMEIAEQLRPEGKYLAIESRPAEFAVADTLDAFVEYVPTIMPEGVVAWMHVTSPFFGSEQIDSALSAYRNGVTSGEADSLMGVTRLQTFLWDESGCISHDRSVHKWPQTQDLRPIYEVNSTIFVIDRELMARAKDRIGARPSLFEVDRTHAFDIDWPDDFQFLERTLQTMASSAS